MDLQIFTTGGTIDKVYFDALSDFKVGAPQIVDILRQVNAGLTYEVQTLMQKDSLELTDADREIIAQHVAEAPCQRVLITHGTGTMVDTAQVLAVHDAITDKTVVLVGSLTPARFKHSDAEFNIGFAIGAVQAMPPGVYVTMNGRIFDPAHVRKNREANAFQDV